MRAFLFTVCCLAASAVFLVTRVNAYYFGTASGGRPGDYLLSLSADAVQAAAGGSGSSFKGSLSGVYLNPASLCYLERDELTVFYRPLYDGGNYYFIGGGHKFGPVSRLKKISYMGFSAVGTESALAEKTTLLRESAGSFNNQEQSFVLSFAYPVKDNLTVGTNVKMVTQAMDGYRASAFGADAGIIAFLKRVNLAFSVQNALPPLLKLKDSTEKYPRNLIFGASSEFYSGKMKPSLDMIVSGSGKAKSLLWKTGCSYLISPVFSLSAGLNYKELTAGFGIKTDPCLINYAFAFHNLGIKHMLSVKMYFSTVAAEEAGFYYEQRKKLETRSEELRKAKKTYDKLTNTAIEYFLNDKYDLARSEFREIAMIESDDEEDIEALFNIEMKIEEKAQKKKVQTLFIAARKQLRKSKFEKSLKIVNEILNIEPANKRAVLLRYKCLAYKALNNGDYFEAKKFLEDALTVDPGNAGISKLLRRLSKFIKEHK
ncbi:MAG: hypothetical protein U9O97_04850 [Elusimicrobiota bacterium]|nr:hypothetical protein [Elusimicrobiota bacterium]